MYEVIYSLAEVQFLVFITCGKDLIVDSVMLG